VSGFEPLTCRLQEACSRAMGPLPAPMPHESATTATETLGFPGDPFHDPFQAAGLSATRIQEPGLRLLVQQGERCEAVAVVMDDAVAVVTPGPPDCLGV
jgi:hypothetical protein